MKLKNKQTGEIVSLEGEITFDDKVRLLKHYNSLAELCEEWSDYEGPKELYFVDARQDDYIGILNTEENPKWCARLIELGLGFETAEETEKAVEKLKAWKRLKDTKFVFYGYSLEDKRNGVVSCPSKAYFDMRISTEIAINEQIKKDLDLLFGGE